MTRPIRIALALTASTLLTITTSLAAGSTDPVQLLDRPDSKWRQGPVKYILDKEEDAGFRKLKTDEERQTFIETFWLKRDPTPGTPTNEFKEIYSRRLELVARRFAPPDGRSWEEDRAKAVLLLGPPDDMEIRQPGRTDEGGADSGAPSGTAPSRRAALIWKHEALPGLPVPLRLEFAEEPDGGYRMLGRFDFTDKRMTGLEPLPVKVVATPQPPAPAQPEPPAAPPPPGPRETLINDVLAATPPDSKVPLAVRVDYYKTSGASTLATVTLAVRKPADGGDAAPLLAARVLSGPEEVAARLEEEDSFTTAGENAAAPAGSDLYYQAARAIPPGKYSLVTAVRDPGAGDVGFVKQEIEVPDFSQQALQISSVTLARKVERMTGAPDPSGRFAVGNFKVFPSVRGEFRPGEEVGLLYQIYNTANDASTGKPKLKVSYQFEKVEKTRTIKIGREPLTYTVDGTVQVYSVPIQPAWWAGGYQVVVKVEDLVAGTTVSSTVPFTVVK